MNSSKFYSGNNRPFGHGFCFSLYSYKSSGSSVRCLLAPCFPSDIVWSITFIIVNSSKGQSRWANTENVEKSLKSSQFFGNSDSAATIIFIRLIMRIFASLKHLVIGFICSFVSQSFPYITVSFWKRQRLFNRPSTIKSLINSTRRNPQFFAPSGATLSFTIESKESICWLSSGLFFCKRHLRYLPNSRLIRWPGGSGRRPPFELQALGLNIIAEDGY
jgi:hypothetical protein